MVSKSLISALSAASLFASTTTALPARTHCRCTIISLPRDLPPSSSSSDLTSSPSTPLDLCTTLGPELENFRHSHPDLYEAYISTAAAPLHPSPTHDAEQPLSTTVLLQLAARNGFQNLGVILPSAPTERPRERIVCRGEDELFSAYQDSLVTLLAIQVVVGLAVLACIAEAVNVGLRCMSAQPRDHHPLSIKAPLRLTGAEKRLRAFTEVEVVFSPGAEKKLRVYASPNWVPRPSSAEKREFEAYKDEDEDDELSRPVM